MRLMRLIATALFCAVIGLLGKEAFAAPRAKTVMLPVHPLAVAEETKAEIARYGAVFSRGQSPIDSPNNNDMTWRY